MTDIDNLPTGDEGADFGNLTVAKARQMIADAEQEANAPDVDEVVAALDAATIEYRADANRRKYLLTFLETANRVLAIATTVA